MPKGCDRNNDATREFVSVVTCKKKQKKPQKQVLFNPWHFGLGFVALPRNKEFREEFKKKTSSQVHSRHFSDFVFFFSNGDRDAYFNPIRVFIPPLKMDG